jgi:hypothetical protein
VAADRFAEASGRATLAVRHGEAEDISRFVTPFAAESDTTAPAVAVGIDPFDRGATPIPVLEAESSSASQPAQPARQRLTAILLADNRRMAVIDDAAVGVGDVLRDGSRVSSIQTNRVWLVDRTGQFRMLSLNPPGQ